MSFKSKTERVLAQGRADRANYSPAAGSVPLKMYQFWANERPSKVPPRENFCHYWRVVAIWAPLWFLLTKVEKALDSKTGKWVGGILFALAVLSILSLGAPASFIVLGCILGALYVIAGVIIGAVSVDDKDEEIPSKVVYAFTLPALIGVGLGKFVAWASSKDKTEVVLDWILKGLFGLLIAGAAALAVYGFIVYPLGGLTVVGILVGLAALVFVFVLVGTYLKDKYDDSKMMRTKFIEEDTGLGFTREVAVVEPTKFGKFMIAVADFFNLAFQVVRVKKWKICPIVEIPNDRV